MKTPNVDLAVFTTSLVVRDKCAIVYISHDEDGTWEFHSKENVSTDMAMVISLGEILEIDPTVRMVLDMPEGSEAHRASSSSDWIVISRG